MNALSNSTNTTGAINRRARRVFVNNARAMAAVKEGHGHVFGGMIFFVAAVTFILVYSIV